MKANIVFKDSIFDEKERRVTVYGSSKSDLIMVANAINQKLVVVNLFIKEDEDSKES